MASSVNAGYSGTPLPKKLGIKEGYRVVVMGAPSHFETLVGPLPAGARMTSGLRGSKPAHVLIIFVRSGSELSDRFTRAQARLHPDGGLWVAWPKRTSSLATELRESDVRAYGLSAGLVDNKICAIDQDWSALRFVVRVENRR